MHKCKYIYIYIGIVREYYAPTPVKLYIQVGKATKVLGHGKHATPGKLYIQVGTSTKVLGHTKLPPPLNISGEDQQQFSGILNSQPP